MSVCFFVWDCICFFFPPSTFSPLTCSCIPDCVHNLHTHSLTHSTSLSFASLFPQLGAAWIACTGSVTRAGACARAGGLARGATRDPATHDVPSTASVTTAPASVYKDGMAGTVPYVSSPCVLGMGMTGRIHIYTIYLNTSIIYVWGNWKELLLSFLLLFFVLLVFQLF